MMKQIYKLRKITVLLGMTLATSHALHAQIPDPLWLTNIGGTGTEIVNNIVVDASGNTYFAGYYTGEFDLDPIGGSGVTLTNNGGNDAVIGKLDPDGKLVWAKKIANTTGTTAESATSLGLDDTGNVYVCGFFNGTTDFDPGTGTTDTFIRTRVGNNDVFVLKLTNNGDFVWAKTMGGTGNDRALAMTVDKTGNTYVTGTFQNTADFQGTSLVSNGGVDIFVQRLDPSGNLVWVTQIGGNGADQSNAIVLGEHYDLYVGGQFTDTANLGGQLKIEGHGNNLDAFITKMDTAGNFIWAKAFGGNAGGDRVEGIALDNFGSIYLTGGFRDTVDFDPGTGVFELIATPNRYLSVDPTSPAVDEAFLMKLDTAGQFIWAKRHGGSQADNGKSISLDGTGSLYLIGDFADTIMIDTFRLASNGSVDVMMIKFDTSGNVIWAGHVGGNSLDHSVAVVVTPLGYIHVAGRYQSHLNTDFYPGTAVYPMPSTLNTGGTSGTIDMFFMRLFACIKVADATLSGKDSICPGETYIYSVDKIPGAVGYEWEFPNSWTVTGSGQEVSATVDEQGGFVRVRVFGLCDTAEISMNVVRNMPPVMISVDEYTLRTTSTDYQSWQWYKDGNIIPGATDPSYTVDSNGIYSVVVTGPDDCKDSASFEVNNVGILDTDELVTATLYPNPAREQLFVHANVPIGCIKVSALDGRTVILHSGHGTFEMVNIANITPGIYLVQIHDTKGNVLGREKFIKSSE